jgi:hypothetical protein
VLAKTLVMKAVVMKAVVTVARVGGATEPAEVS